jgi:hypothetical protein
VLDRVPGEERFAIKQTGVPEVPGEERFALKRTGVPEVPGEAFWRLCTQVLHAVHGMHPMYSANIPPNVDVHTVAWGGSDHTGTALLVAICC